MTVNRTVIVASRQLPAQRAERIASVLDQRLDESQPALITVCLLYLIDTPKLASCRPTCLSRRHPATQVFVGEAIEMGLNLVVQLGLTIAPVEQSAHTRQKHRGTITARAPTALQDRHRTHPAFRFHGQLFLPTLLIA
jgi:hypothetical protein